MAPRENPPKRRAGLRPGGPGDRCESILGFPVSSEPLDALAARALSWLDSAGRGRYFVCANPHSLEVARRDPRFARAILDADFAVPDGAGIVFASRVLGGGIRRRVTGCDLFRTINARLDAMGGRRCFFLGSTAGNLERIRSRMAATHPGIGVAGVFAPPFKPVFDEEDCERMVRAVNAASPDVLWVGMTAPKQETWVSAHRERLDAKLIGPVGAVFDYFTGNVLRPHPWFLAHGLEWLPRLLRQPRRLWRRSLVSSPSFLLRVLRQRFAPTVGGSREG